MLVVRVRDDVVDVECEVRSSLGDGSEGEFHLGPGAGSAVVHDFLVNEGREGGVGFDGGDVSTV